MTIRIDRVARDAASKGLALIRSLQRQAPAANMIGRFAVGHLVSRLRVFPPDEDHTRGTNSGDPFA